MALHRCDNKLVAHKLYWFEGEPVTRPFDIPCEKSAGHDDDVCMCHLPEGFGEDAGKPFLFPRKP